MQILAVLAKQSRNRGLIAWSFQADGDTCVAVRNDGRRYPYASKEEMRTGYKKIRDEYGYQRVA